MHLSYLGTCTRMAVTERDVMVSGFCCVITAARGGENNN